MDVRCERKKEKAMPEEASGEAMCEMCEEVPPKASLLPEKAALFPQKAPRLPEKM